MNDENLSDSRRGYSRGAFYTYLSIYLTAGVDHAWYKRITWAKYVTSPLNKHYLI